MLIRNYLTAVLLVAGCAVPASASLTTYSTLSNLESAAPGDTFSNITFAQGGLGTSTTDDGITFSDTGQLQGLENDPGWSGATGISTYNGLSTIVLTIPSSVNAIGFYVYGLGGYVSITDDSGGSYANGSPLPDGFFGIATGSTFSTFTISANNGTELAIGDIYVGEAQATPEVATLLLVGTGLLGMGFIRRRANRRQTLQPATA